MPRVRFKTNRAVFAALTVAFLGAVLLVHPACGRRAPALKHVIFFIGDRMSAQPEGPPPRLGRAAANPFPPGPATDSASAATALATGFKTDSGNIAWLPGDPAGGELPTITEEYRAKTGAGIGIISTVPVKHETPAAFVSHN